MTILSCNQVKKTFDGKKFVLEDIDLEVEEEEFIIIAGPPGAGKTTLLSIFGGYITPTEGNITILGRNICEMTSLEEAKFRRENLGVVFQKGCLIPSLTVLENVMIPCMFKKNACIDGLNVLSYMGIEEKKNCYPDELSGAEEELVELSRALINQPKLLLLDEPTQFLDHSTGVKVMTYLRQMALDHQMTIITILNDVRLFPFASRIIRMKGGKITDVLGESFIDSPFLRI